MAYLHTLAGYKEMEAIFNAAGYTLDVELGNDLIIQKVGADEDDLVDYDDLSEELKEVLDGFANKYYDEIM